MIKSCGHHQQTGPQQQEMNIKREIEREQSEMDRQTKEWKHNEAKKG